LREERVSSLDWLFFWNSFRSFFLFFIVFAIFHSLSAQEIFKDLLARCLGSFFVKYFWRFSYCLISWVLLYPICINQLGHIPPVFNVQFYKFSEPLRIFVDVARVLGLVIFLWAILQFDYLSFLGIKQLIQGIQILRGGRAPFNVLVSGVDHLEVKGIYRFLRHPMAVGGVLSSLPLGGLSVTWVFFFALAVSYLLVGNHIEERRLIKNFGDQYLDYKRDVGGYFPRVFKS
jgi:methanethiol S-methyltransferase